jgi:rhodanese-related sulfurtransferase
VLVDVLDEQYYRQLHLPGAINVPLESVDEAEVFLPDKSVEVVVYCMSTLRGASEEAACELAAMGYTSVRDYPEGKQGWIQADLPYEESQD